MSPDIGKELRIMHACEQGAVGVYRGHKWVTRYFFRTNLAELDNIRFHEKSHVSTIAGLLTGRHMRMCHGHWLIFWGGLFYGVFIGVLGLRAIGASTQTIEEIVDRELEETIKVLVDEPPLNEAVKKIQLEEQEHRDAGAALAGERSLVTRFVCKVASWGAYTAKYTAARL